MRGMTIAPQWFRAVTANVPLPKSSVGHHPVQSIRKLLEIVMRAIIVVFAVVLLFALLGWISFSKGPARSSINLETDQIRTDTNKAMQSGADLLHKAGDKVEHETTPADDRAAPVERESAPVSR
jgi:hypothetical protein